MNSTTSSHTKASRKLKKDIWREKGSTKITASHPAISSTKFPTLVEKMDTLVRIVQMITLLRQTMSIMFIHALGGLQMVLVPAG